MAIGSISSSVYPPSSQQQNGPAASQPLSMVSQYRQTRLEEALVADRQAYMAGDTASVQSLTSEIIAQASQSGLPQPYIDRITQDAKNPGPAVLNADILFMKAVNAPDSVFGAATKSTYSSGDLDALNSQDSDSDAGTDSSSFNDIGNTTNMPQSLSTQSFPPQQANNLMQTGSGAIPQQSPSTYNNTPAFGNGFGAGAPAA